MLQYSRRNTYACVAQLVEQLICNQQVGGSNPSTSSTRRKLRLVCDDFFCKKLKVIAHIAPLLLVIPKKPSLRLTCSVVNALATVRFCFGLFRFCPRFLEGYNLTLFTRSKLRLVCDDFFCKKLKVIAHTAPLLLVFRKSRRFALGFFGFAFFKRLLNLCFGLSLVFSWLHNLKKLKPHRFELTIVSGGVFIFIIIF